MMRDKAGEVSTWWSSNPQTYGDRHGKPQYVGTQDSFGEAGFFEDADRQFFAWNRELQDKEPFDLLFPYDQFHGKRVGAQVTAVDLAPFSVQMTSRRFSLMGLTGNILQADGRALPLGNGEFDYVYSWGVLHHSPDLAQSLGEMMRVLKPGGKFG